MGYVMTKEIKGDIKKFVTDDAIPFESEECERQRKQYLQMIQKPQKMDLSEDTKNECDDRTILQGLLKILPERYRSAKYRIIRDKCVVLSDIPEYRIDFRYEDSGRMRQDTIVLRCVSSKTF